MGSYKKLKNYCYFSSLSDLALKELFNKLDIVNIPAGTSIINEDSPADAFYLVKKGEVEVIKKTRWGQSAKISVLGSGEGFGEMALLTCSPRYCTVNAKTDVTLLKLLKSDFEEIVRMDSAFSQIMENRIQDFAEFNQIKTLMPFALLEPEKMIVLINELGERKYAPGENIIEQGEKGNEYFIVKSGLVSVLKENENGEASKVATISAGEGFGEEALIANQSRGATVQAVNETIVWVLSKTHFDRVMRSSFLKEIAYEKVQEDKKDQIYLDIRMKAEFDEEHIPTAINIPLDELRNRFAELDKSAEYYVYCLVGARSATAAFLLNSHGYKARSIKGGILNWPGPVEEGGEGIHTPFKPT